MATKIVSDVGTELAKEGISYIISPLKQLMVDIMNFQQNQQLLENNFKRLNSLLDDMSILFEARQKAPPQTVKNSVQRVKDTLEMGKQLIQRAQRAQLRSQQQQRCHDCLHCNPKLSRQIREWHASFNNLVQDVHTDFRLYKSIHQIASSQQPVPPPSSIEFAQTQLETWLQTANNSLSRQIASSPPIPEQETVSSPPIPEQEIVPSPPIPEQEQVLGKQPESGYKEPRIRSAQMELQTWLMTADDWNPKDSNADSFDHDEEQIVPAAPQLSKEPSAAQVPDWNILKWGIKSVQTQLQTWVKNVYNWVKCLSGQSHSEFVPFQSGHM